MDPEYRRLERLAKQGDEAAQKKLFKLQVRLRGYPEGPWDDPLVLRDFTMGVGYLPIHPNYEQDGVPPGQMLYVSNAPGYIGVIGGPVISRVSAGDARYVFAEEFHPRGFLWLNGPFYYRHYTGLLDEPYDSYPGCTVMFSGQGDSYWRATICPVGNRELGLYVLDRLTNRQSTRAYKKPVIEAWVEEDRSITFGPVEP